MKWKFKTSKPKDYAKLSDASVVIKSNPPMEISNQPNNKP
jgi:hypothetical protein